MFKKSLIAGVILMGVSSVALAHADYKGERHVVAKPAPTATVETTTVASESRGIPYVGIGIGNQTQGSFDGLIGSIFGGYGAKLGADKKVYVGGEIFAEAGSIALAGRQYGNRTQYALGASFIPGYMILDSLMAYGRLGVKGQHFQGSNNTTTGTQLGGGLQAAICKHWDLRGEYVYTSNRVFKNFSYGTNQVNLGLVYKFD